MAAATTVIAAAAIFDPNFNPTAGVSRPAGESALARMKSAKASRVASSDAEYATAQPSAPQRLTDGAAAASAAASTSCAASTSSIVEPRPGRVYRRRGIAAVRPAGAAR